MKIVNLPHNHGLYKRCLTCYREGEEAGAADAILAAQGREGAMLTRDRLEEIISAHVQDGNGALVASLRDAILAAMPQGLKGIVGAPERRPDLVIEETNQEVLAEEARVQRLTVALEWYGNPETWEVPDGVVQPLDLRLPFLHDRGKVARAALKEAPLP